MSTALAETSNSNRVLKKYIDLMDLWLNHIDKLSIEMDGWDNITFKKIREHFSNIGGYYNISFKIQNMDIEYLYNVDESMIGLLLTKRNLFNDIVMQIEEKRINELDEIKKRIRVNILYDLKERQDLFNQLYAA